MKWKQGDGFIIISGYKLSGNEMEKDQMQPNIFFPFFTVVNWTWMLL